MPLAESWTDYEHEAPKCACMSGLDKDMGDDFQLNVGSPRMKREP